MTERVSNPESKTMSAAATVSSGESSWILLNMYAKVGENTNETTAHCQVSDDMKICASLVRERPPLPSNLYVHCSGAAFAERPSSLSMVDDLILFHVYIGPEYRARSALPSYFFMYRADPKRPSLELLPQPPPQDWVRLYHPVGIFPRGGEDNHYTVASMIPLQFEKGNLFSLRLYDSETKTWSSKNLSVESPQEEFPIAIPNNYCHLLSHHNTSTAFTLGETIGWVDLWRGVLFCDMLSGHHTLRGVPLPLPLNLTKPGGADSSEELGSGRTHRGIAFVGGHLRLVEVGFKAAAVVYDQETGSPRSRIENWTITTWTNKEMSNSYDDWRMDGTIQASDIFLGDHSESELPPIDLHNLYVSDPVIGMNGNDMHVVYLTARENFRHPKSWVLAIDTRDRKVQSVVAMPGPLSEEMPYFDANYCTCTIISK
ncbi:hypothetical protein ACQ4PT_012050 [Festuca glaucescens]